jgi:hypothetical protein
MKNTLSWIGFTVLAFSACQSDTFTVNGELTGFDEGMPAYLMAGRFDGRGIFPVDSVRLSADGTFTLETQTEKTETFYLFLGDLRFNTPYAVEFFGAPGKTNRITGERSAPRAWRVESRIPEQQGVNRFWDATRSLMREQDRLIAAMNRAENASEADSLQAEEARLWREINRIELNLILENPNTSIAVDRLARLAWAATEHASWADLREDIERAYNGLTPEFQASLSGEAVREALSALHPSVQD